MKKYKLFNLLFSITVFALIFTGCKKDNSSSPTLTIGQTSEQVQNADQEDAVTDRSDQTTDNTLDQLQANNYIVPSTKAAGSVTITVTKSDSTTFPKTITIVYNQYHDSTAGEKFVLNGEIDVTVTTPIPSKVYLISRAITFKSFSVTTDSTTYSVSGLRTVTRNSLTYEVRPKLAGIRFVITDSIDANTNWSVTTTGSPDSLKFTRHVRRVRKSDINFVNVNTASTKWSQIVLVTYPHLDTIIWTGTITGINENNNGYTRTITTPLQGTWYSGSPVLIAGAVSLNISSTPSESYTITFMRDLPNHPYKTLVTVTNTVTNKTWSFDRSFGNKFFKSW